jgi:hypothetical protein
MKNLGPKSWEMFHQASIPDEEALRNMGAVAAFVAVENVGLKPSLNLLDAIAAGL